jgi:hypothetical protein
MKDPRVEQKLIAFLGEYADPDRDLYWYPLVRLKKELPVSAYDLGAIFRDGEIAALEKLFSLCGISCVSTFQTDSLEYFENDEMAALLNEKDDAGYCFPRCVETFYFDASESWLVYVSHEETISFTGEEIVRAAAISIPERYRL